MMQKSQTPNNIPNITIQENYNFVHNTLKKSYRQIPLTKQENYTTVQDFVNHLPVNALLVVAYLV